MGATYTKAQREASLRYVNSTDQIRVRTEKGNLDFIKSHADEMGESFGEFVNRAIMEAIYRDRGETLVEQAKSEEYGIKGNLLASKDGYYEIDYMVDGERMITRLDPIASVPQKFLSDYAWMMLENAYEDRLLEKEKNRE